ncbi:hypothetical protein [Rariglobus hedericola]|uniref:Uncharacterized protein n=1 Tax=Rariglobus hedericola TaxID=2597822 RepID=A0A556QDM1_9BACT|nr:hypothetical protein [Rariglobus hedericola]TSJ74745.1 hypothetical protein FPL22_17540 [Rariglobus hedericola]
MKKTAFICFVAILLLAIGLARPPVEGHYYCWLFSYLNGSRGYIVLQDGNVAQVNEKDKKIEFIPSIGNYERLSNGLVRINIDYGNERRSDDVSIGWLGFQFDSKFGKGAPESSCRAKREFRPWILQNLK